MKSLRSWYIYLASGVSLLVLAFQTIALLRGLLAFPGGSPVAQTAFQVAAIVVALPFYIVHWLWAQRLSRDKASTVDDVGSVPRTLYLYVLLAVFGGVLVDQGILLVRSLMDMALGVNRLDYGMPASHGAWVVFALCAILVAGLLWFYHFWVLRSDNQSGGETPVTATIRQVYVYAFSAVGLLLFSLGAFEFLRLLLENLLPTAQFFDGDSQRRLVSVVTGQLIVGLVVWILFWRYAQDSFEKSVNFDQRSVVRKIYLYIVLFFAVLFFVTFSAVLMSALIGGWVGAPETTDDGPGAAVAAIIVSGLIWVFHARVLQSDTRYIATRERQALVQRLYRYLMAGIGLGAFLVGLGGLLSVLIRGLASAEWVGDLLQQFSWFSAALLAGLPVWLIHWRQVQFTVTQTETGGAERRSFVRSFYLYFFLLAATITVLASLVYIVSQVVELMMADRTGAGLVVDIGQAVAYSLIGVGVWLYHGYVLQQDRQSINALREASIKKVRVWIYAVESPYKEQLLELLEKRIPSVEIMADDATKQEAGEAAPPDSAPGLDFVISTWQGLGSGQMLQHMDALKILIALPHEGWVWAGAVSDKGGAAVEAAVHTIRSMIEKDL